MKKNLLTLCVGAVLSALAFPLSAADEIFLVKEAEQNSLRHYYYDANNNIVRASDVNAAMTTPLYHYFYSYENSLLVEEYYTQWKDMGEWTDPRDRILYTYDEQGRLIAKENTMTNRKQEYSYNEDGYLVKIVDMGKNYGSTEYDKTYSTTNYLNFDENGNPALAQYDDALYVSSSYDEYYTYDEQGRMLTKESYKLDGTPKNKFEYAYDDFDILISSIKSVNDGKGGFEYSSRNTRTDLGNNTYEYNYDEFWSGEWINHDSYTEYYSELKGEYAPRNLVLNDISTDESPNTIELVCDVPEVEVPNAKYIVWRDWERVAILEPVDGKITYTDSGVANSVKEYFVQSYDAVNDVLYNISNIAPVDFTTELPAITELRYLGTIEGFAADAQGASMPAYFVKFEWDAPETELPIVGYKVYDVLSFGEGFDSYYIELHTTTSTVDSVSVFREPNYDSPDQQKATTVMVTVLYELGESEGVVETFPIENPNAAVEGVKVERVAYVAGDNLFVEVSDADVAIYNAAGALVSVHSDVSRVGLDNLATGAYIVRVKAGNVVQTIKIAR